MTAYLYTITKWLPTRVIGHETNWKFTTWVITINLWFLPHMQVLGIMVTTKDIFKQKVTCNTTTMAAHVKLQSLLLWWQKSSVLQFYSDVFQVIKYCRKMKPNSVSSLFGLENPVEKNCKWTGPLVTFYLGCLHSKPSQCGGQLAPQHGAC